MWMETGPDFGRGLLLDTGTWSWYRRTRSEKKRKTMSYTYVAELLFNNRMGEMP